jgi:biotin-(acetyl-CoA carboxylase) ligase
MFESWVQDHREMPSSLRALDLPPPFRLVALREVGDAFSHASAHAAELGAGTLVVVGRFDRAEFAVVLEPEEALVSARRSFYAGMTALADALSALAPPETPITIAWPDRLEVNGRLVGGGRLGWPRPADEHERPDWLVFGGVIRLVSMRSGEAALDPQATALADEGFGELAAERLVEGFARHLMVAIDCWQEGDFGAIAQSYLARLQPEGGARRAIDVSGNLRIERPREPVACLDLRAVLAAPSWFPQCCFHRS